MIRNLIEIRSFMKSQKITVRDLADRLDQTYSYVNHRLLGYVTPSGSWLVDLQAVIKEIIEERTLILTD
jgi:transcriptional regulator with XRE-family HTH domain